MKTPTLSSSTVKWLDVAVSRLVDCWLEAKDNVDRQEWLFARENLRKLFKQASSIARRRERVLRRIRGI
jgi:hypothetical protein